MVSHNTSCDFRLPAIAPWLFSHGSSPTYHLAPFVLNVITTYLPCKLPLVVFPQGSVLGPLHRVNFHVGFPTTKRILTFYSNSTKQKGIIYTISELVCINFMYVIFCSTRKSTRKSTNITILHYKNTLTILRYAMQSQRAFAT